MADRGRVGMDRCKAELRDSLLKKHRSIHERNMREIQGRKRGSGTLDNNQPYTTRLSHMRVNLKREAMREERAIAVNKDNQHLIEQIARMAVRPSQFTVDAPVDPKSNTAKSRFMRLQNIEAENKRLAERLGSVGAVYSNKEAAKSRREHMVRAVSSSVSCLALA